MKIGILAFPADQQTKLQRILSLSKTRAYELVETPEKGSVDLLVVFGEEGLSLSNDFDLPSSHILVASRVAPPKGHPHLKLPFISSRVLRIIDGIAPLAKSAATPEPKPAVSPQPNTTEARPAAAPQPAPVAKPQQPEELAPTAAPTQPVQPAARPVTPAPATTHAQPSATVPAAAPQAQPTASPAPAPKAPSSTPAAAPQAEPVTKQPPAADAQPSPAPVAPVTPAAKPAPQADAGSDDKDNLFKKYDSQIEEAQRQKAQQDAAASSMEYSVLVVDDSHAMQQVLAKELAKLEQTINVDFADDGESALAKVAEATYDFIFLDIMMPGIDGFETCTQMRALPNLKKTPIIMLSSKTSPLDEVKGIMAGSSTYLTKPIDSDEFLKVIKRVSRWITEFKK